MAPPCTSAVWSGGFSERCTWAIVVHLELALPSTRSGALRKSKEGKPTAFRLTVADAVSARQGKQLYIDLRSADFFNVGELTVLRCTNF